MVPIFSTSSLGPRDRLCFLPCHQVMPGHLPLPCLPSGDILNSSFESMSSNELSVLELFLSSSLVTEIQKR